MNDFKSALEAFLKKKVEIYAFQGKRRLASPEQPLIATGHVGLSLDGNKIYGFNPIISPEMKLLEVYHKIKMRECLPGQVTDDTELFEKAK